MNRSIVFQICYAVAMFLALAFTVAGMFTPGWRTVSGLDDDKQPLRDEDIPKGLFELHCPKGSAFKCDWWEDMPAWNKVVFFAISFAIIVEFVALVWDVLSFVLSAHRRVQLACFIALSVIAAFLLGIVLTNFAANDIISEKILGHKISFGVGYSYYLTCVAFLICLFAGGFAIAAFYYGGHHHHTQGHGEIAYNW